MTIFVPNEHEIEVLQMMAKIIPWEKGAWVNACYEFLQESGYCTRDAIPTEKGMAFLAELMK